MSSGKQRGYAYDVDAWIQFHLLRLASFNPATTKADLAVLAEIIQRYWGKYGNGWVTHQHLGEAAGISKATVIRAKRNLETLGFITVVQAGRRGSATVYRPNFELVPRKGVTDDTENKGVMDDTKTVQMGCTDDTLTPQYGVMDDTPSYLHDRPTRAGSQKDRDDSAPPSAPLPDGLAATVAGGAEERFEELWRTYGYRQRKADARAAYRKAAPDDGLHARMVEAAAAWQSSWAAQGKPNAPRFTLAKWLDREEYECDPPTTYQAKERKPKAKPTAEPANDNLPDEPIPEALVGSPRLWPKGDFLGEFVDGDTVLEEGGKDIRVDLTFLINSEGEHHGRKLVHRFYPQSSFKSAQTEGQEYLHNIAGTLGVISPDDVEDFLFKPLRVRATGHKLLYGEAA